MISKLDVNNYSSQIYGTAVAISKTECKELFSDALSDTANVQKACGEEYLNHLKQKYGGVTVKSIGKSQEELENVGKAMSGSDVIIAPNMLEKMAGDPKLAYSYESKIDNFFAEEPKMQRIFAAKGLTYEACGAVIHEDGTLTLICGGGDSPERVAEVNRINRERDEARALARKMYFENAAQTSAQRRSVIKENLQDEYNYDLLASLYFINKTAEMNTLENSGYYYLKPQI